MLLRVEVAPAPGHADPLAAAVVRDAATLALPVTSARTAHVYLIQPDPRSPISPAQLDVIRNRLLADPVTEVSTIGASPVSPNHQLIEVHPLPGVMDPVAQSVRWAIAEILSLDHAPDVSTGWRYDLTGPGLTQAHARTLSERLLANPVIQRIHTEPLCPSAFPVSHPHAGGMGSVPLRTLSPDALDKLSRDAHLFLSRDEMLAIQAHYTRLGREPREIELETLAQTWSEHCVHKTLKSTIRYTGPDLPFASFADRPNHRIEPGGTLVISNLLKSTIAAATRELTGSGPRGGIDWTLSVFVDNSGVIAFDETTAVCIKVETHNRPSAIEPYGGAATGIGGCIRDVIGTGLGARPIASTDVFCVAPPNLAEVPQGCLPPRRILTQVVAGVRDYGNRMGIPTVAGAVDFDPRYVGNPLVYCGCIGVLPRSCVHGQVHEGDLIVALGGRTGRDGIHGATFSSAEIAHTAADEFAHAVQIGNAITEKQVLDAILRARDEYSKPLYHAMTDCGAGGFSSAVGEMGKSTGATVHLDRAPLKYAGLSPTEIWISEAQERMVLAVPEASLSRLQRICDEESVELAVLGAFAPPAGSRPGDPDLALMYKNQEVGRISMHLLHEGIPMPTREATWNPKPAAERKPWAAARAATLSPRLTAHPSPELLCAGLLKLLSHPSVASKHWIIRQYDHEVRGSTVIKPLVGPLTRGPGDASVITPIAGSFRGLAVACGLATGIGDPALGGDPYLAALAGIDEAVRNLVCVGADPSRIAILDNFCWPSCKKPENLGALVRSCEGCYDGAMAYRTPFVSGKDSLHNEFTGKDGVTIAIPPTLLITGIGIVPDIRRCVTMDAKEPGNLLMLVGLQQAALGGSRAQQTFELDLAPDLLRVPRVDLTNGPASAKLISELIRAGHVQSAHDISDAGLLATVAEMLIAGSSPARSIGAAINLPSGPAIAPLAAAFAEGPSCYVLEVTRADRAAVEAACSRAHIPCTLIGELDSHPALSFGGVRTSVDELAHAWLSPLDW
jgi:phosphoribosylformylglycinamidine synthase subunit PurSL